jgi:tetratricopeptide (TPR) repeat protein
MASVRGAPAKPKVDDETCDLDDATVAGIVTLDAMLAGQDHYSVLGVERGAEKKAIKRAYYALAAQFHPDRFFGKKLGRARAPLDRIFHRVTEAHDVLTDKAKRAEYDARLPGAAPKRASRAPPAGKTRTFPPRKPSKQTKAVSTPPAAAVPRRPTTPPKRTSTLPPKRGRTKRPPDAELSPVVVMPDIAPVSERSLRRVYEAAQQIESQRHVEVFLRAAEEALAVDDVIGAANNYRLALQSHDDPWIRRKLDDIEDQAKNRRNELNLTRARAAERDRRWSDAATFYAKAHDARPAAPLAERAAFALRMSDGDLERAIELAQYAVGIDPKNAGYRTTLGEVFLAAGEIKQAVAESARALELAPSDARAKDLAAVLKKRK